MITKHPTSRTLIVHPLGDLDTLRTDHYRRQLRSLIDEGYRFLIFDLQETPYINSSGLGLLIELLNKTSRLEGSVKLINCSPHVRWILEQTKLDKILIDSDTEPIQHDSEVPYDRLYSFMSDEILLLAQIYDVTEQIMGLDESRAIGDLIMRGLHRALHGLRGAFFIFDPEKRRLSLASWVDQAQNPSRPDLPDIYLEPGRSELKVIQENEVIWHELCDKDKLENNVFYRLGFETLLVAPIHGRQRTYGLLLIEAGPATMKLIQTSRPVVRTFSNICGLAMEKTTLNEQMRNQNQTMDDLIVRARGTHQALTEASKLAALGVVVSGLSHLINNKMVPMMGYTQMLAQKPGLPEWVTEKVARIQASGNEMTQIVEKLTKISRVHDKSLRPIDHAELIRNSLELLTWQIEMQDITVDVQLAGDPPLIEANPDLLLQALLALLHRACTSFAADSAERWIRVSSEAAPDGLKIIIEDNGRQFDEYDQDGWLDPIVPTDAMDGGMIFNYTIPRGIIKKHRGKLALEPGTEGGKKVTIFLPATAAQPA